MGSVTSVVLIVPYIGYNYVDSDLDRYLKAAIDPTYLNQHLAPVSGPQLEQDLPGSAQAGTIQIYRALLRNTSDYHVLEYLKRAPWGDQSAVLWIEHDSSDDPKVYYVGESINYQGELR